MRIRILLFLAVFSLALSPFVLAQGRIEGKLTVGSTPLSQGDVKIGETLTTQDGIEIPPGVYRIAVTLNSLGEGQFVISPFKVTQPGSVSGLEKNAANARTATNEAALVIFARVNKNLLVKQIASNLEGSFRLNTVTPTEVELLFESKQFAATALLGRNPSSKLIDLSPSFVALDQTSSCGEDCIEGTVNVTIRNDGNSPATGKWNVTILEPRLYVGTVTDVPAGGEKTVSSAGKIKLPCCNPAHLDVEVHADFFNKVASDANETNDQKRFVLKLKED